MASHLPRYRSFLIRQGFGGQGGWQAILSFLRGWRIRRSFSEGGKPAGAKDEPTKLERPKVFAWSSSEVGHSLCRL